MRATGPPIDLGRDEARELAERELADPVYEDEPSLQERVLDWLLERVDDLLRGAGALSPGSWLALLALVAVLVVTAVVIVRRSQERARAVEGGAVFAATPRTAAEHLAAADAAAARGDWERAVTERFRAVVRRLEERGVLDEVPGRTADEVVAEAGGALPAAAAALREGAQRFDRVRYGGMPATAEDDALLRALVGAVSTTRPGASAAEAPALAVPR